MSKLKRVWLYLDHDDIQFLSNIGYLTGCITRNEQIKFVIKTFRLLIPDPSFAYAAIPEFPLTLKASYKRLREGKERAWVYLNEDDILYIDTFGSQIGEHKRGRIVLYLIRLLKIILPNASEIVKKVSEIVSE